MMCHFKVHSRVAKTKGYTLIELMIVLSLIALTLSVIGPFSIQSIERASAKSEMLELKQQIKNIGNKAFLHGQAYKLVTKRHSVVLSKLNGNVVWTQEFKYLSFTPLVITFNTQGYAIPGIFTVNFKNTTKRLNLNAY
ncbi:hypothetical protein CWC18_01435 [Pseudoalteromonas aurantia]|uniref:type II secretion system protein n=1 Tax=Pseudoalteromonas aurantia TaxID=43654 RepID=UPI00110BF200|nr:hypothetical protein CWC18_01435 [Pseudoalteromonas aurantia]